MVFPYEVGGTAASIYSHGQLPREPRQLALLSWQIASAAAFFLGAALPACVLSERVVSTAEGGFLVL